MALEEEKSRPSVEHDLALAAETSAVVGATVDKTTIQEAADHTMFMHEMTIRQAVKYYRWAIFWCIAVR